MKSLAIVTVVGLCALATDATAQTWQPPLPRKREKPTGYVRINTSFFIGQNVRVRKGPSCKLRLIKCPSFLTT